MEALTEILGQLPLTEEDIELVETRFNRLAVLEVQHVQGFVDKETYDKDKAVILATLQQVKSRITADTVDVAANALTNLALKGISKSIGALTSVLLV